MCAYDISFSDSEMPTADLDERKRMNLRSVDSYRELMFRRLICILLVCTGLIFVYSSAQCENTDEVVEYSMITDDGEEFYEDVLWEDEAQEKTPRDDFIDRIISMGKQLYEESGGHAQRAHYASDIYVCKNFTTYLFRKNRDAFRMAEFPDTKMVIPDNLPAKECRPYAYGFLWKDVPPEKGNPFYVAAQFRYDSDLSKEENMVKAIDFMKEVKRGDFFQMSADYEYGVGAHSAIMISDYDPQTDSVHWMDSNMRGKKVKGIRYGIVQYDEEKSIEWWASCFCHKKRGATLYRLREDIIYSE